MTGTSPLKLMAILAHPDDESLGLGSTLARYAAEGVETHLVTATRGQRGWLGEPSANPGLKALGEIRERELRASVDRDGPNPAPRKPSLPSAAVVGDTSRT
jgi:LmbE family N-acetylglucosaminyl deacetylase